MTMLPDIDQVSYDEYEKERLRRELEQKQQGFGLQQMIGEKIAGLQSIVGGAIGGLQQPAAPPTPPAPPVAAPAPEPPPESAPVLPEPAPAPEPVPSPSQVELAPEPAPAPAPVAEPAPAIPSPVAPSRQSAVPPSPPPPPSGGTPGGGGLQDWIGSTMGAAIRSGADMQKFAQNFRPSAGIEGVLGAAVAAGADMQSFASSLTAPPPPAQTPTASAGPTPGAVGAPVAPGGDLRAYARQAAQRNGIDPDIFERQIQQESGFNPSAKSGAGAIGIAQFMPGTAAGMKVDPTDPYAALDAAARMNAQNLQKYGGDYSKMLAAYNAGGGAVDKYGGVPPFEETQRYVKNIMSGQTPRQMVRGAVEGAGEAVGGWLDLAKQQLNKPYIWGSGSGAGGRGTGDINPQTGLPNGFDCSGYVSWVMKNGLGVDVPAQTSAAYGKLQAISADQARPGDIVFYNMDTPDPHMQHMAIYIGNGQIIQAGGTDRKVNIASVNSVGAPEFRRAAGTEAADSRQLVGATVQGAAGANNQPTPNLPPEPQFQVDKPLVDPTTGRLTRAATGLPETYMGTMQQAASVEPPKPIESPGDRLKSAFSDFIDSVGGAKDAAGGAVSSLLVSPAGQPAQSQALPSDSLTNPLGSRYNEPESAQLTGQPSGAINDTGRPAVIPSLGDARDAILRGDTQGALDALDQAGGAFASSPVGRQVINPENRPLSPGAPLRENIANAPVLGGTLGALRPTIMLTDQEVISQHRPEEIQTARNVMEQWKNAGVKYGDAPEPVTDEDVAGFFRDMDVSLAYATTHTPAGAAAKLGATAAREIHGRAPRLSEGAIPATGVNYQQAFDQLGVYPAWVRSGIEDFVNTIEAPASEKAKIVYQWMQENPLASITDHPGVAALQTLQEDLATKVRGGGPQLPGGAQPGQLGLDESAFGRGAQPLLPTGEGGVFNPEMLLPDYVPKSTQEAAEIARWRRQLAESRARDEAGGGMPLTGLEQVESDIGKSTRQQPLLPESGGTFDPTELLKDYIPKSQQEAEQLARWREQIRASREREAAGGGLPLTDLEQSQLGGFIPAALEMPKRVPENVGKLIEAANQAVSERTAAIDPERLAKQAGTTVERINKVWQPDKSDANHDMLRAVSRAIDDSGAKLTDLQKALARDPESNDATVAFVKQLTQHQALQEVLEAKAPVAAEAMKRLAPNSRAAHAEALNQLEAMAKRFKMKDGDELASYFSKVDLSEPDAVNNLADIARSFTFGDKAAAVWYFALLSSPLTHIKNTLGNITTAAVRPVETAGSALMDPLARRVLGDEGPRQRYWGEVGKEIEGAARSFDKGLPQALSAIREGWVPERTGDISSFTREAFRDTKGEFLHQPGRWLTAEDAVFRNLNEGASRYGIAYREASKMGLKGEELKDMTARLIQQPTKDMLKEIGEQGSYRVFQNKTRLATSLNRLRDDYPALRYLMPFTSTPINIARYVGERSPLGAGKILWDLKSPGGRARLAERGSGELADRMSRASIGSLVWGWAAKQAIDGNITGGYPSDEAERDQWRRTGKQAYSFKNPVSGEWTSYQALPFAQLFSTAGDVGYAVNKAQLKDKNDLLNIGAEASLAVGKDILSPQFFQGVTDFMDAWSSTTNSRNAVQNWIDQQAASAVPAIVRDTSRVFDDTVRNPNNAWESVAANIPGISHAVPARLDAFGQEVKRPSSGIEAILNPMPGTRDISETDPVEKELARLQGRLYKVEPGLVGKQVTVEGEPVELDDPQQARYQRQSGKLAKNELQMIIGTPEWNDMSDPEKEKYIADTFSDARKFVREGLEPELLGKAFESWKHKQRARLGAD